METKLCVSLCALLLLSFGSADHESDPGLPSATPSAPGSVTDRTLSTLTDAPVTKIDVNNTRIVDGSNVTANPTAVTNCTTSHFTTQKGSDTNATLAGTLEPPDHHTSSLTTIPLNEAHSSTSTPGSLQTSTTASSPDVTSDLHNKAGIKTTVKTTESNSISSTNHITTNVITSSHPTTGVPNKSPTKPASVTTTKTEVRADTPSKLNVKGDTTMDHKSPPLDPLLAGLVSAFIVTAIIITLLLFLKLRRRDTRPEFRRLQDLPMDDMMEDTPLSMYSY